MDSRIARKRPYLLAAGFLVLILLAVPLMGVSKQLERLPIRLLALSIPVEKKQYEQVVNLVDQMLSLHNQLPKTPHEQELLKRQIETTDRQIDQLVYELYGLSKEEQEIVRKAAS